jgi:spore maturation protein CgeB
MRFLMAHPGPHFSVHDLYAGWTDALRAVGQQVLEFNLQDRLTFYGTVLLETAEEGKFKKALTGDQATELAINGLYAALLKTRPHVLFVVSGFFVPAELLDIARAAGVRVVLLCTESPYEDRRQAELAAHADLTLINDPTNRSMFPPETLYLPHAYRPALHHTGAAPPHMECDLGFVGTAYPSRVEFFEALDLDGLDVILAGNWQLLPEGHRLRQYLGHEITDCLDNADAADVYRGARVGLNLYRREAERPELSAGWAMGPREVEMAACGAFFLRDPRGEGDELLDMLPVFTSPAEASEQLRWWLARPDERRAAAFKARDAVADRTFDNHARRLLRLLEKE